MTFLKLSGAERQRIVDVLLTTHGDRDLQLLVEREVPEIMNRVRWGQPVEYLFYSVVEQAERFGATSELLLAAAKERGSRPELLSLVIELCERQPGRLASVQAYGRSLEEVVHPFAGFLDPSELATKLVCHERHVCAVEVGEKAGTGLLVASDLVLTNYHVVADLIAGAIGADDVACLFDYRMGLDGAVKPPVRVRLDPDWSIPHRSHETKELPAATELDYALLRLEQKIGDLRPTGEGEPRCWFDLSRPPPEPVRERLAFVLQHPRKEMWRPGEPRQQPLRVGLGLPGFDGYNGNGTRLRYRVNTLPGSSGSAVFDERLRLVALHSSRGQPVGTSDGRVVNNQGIPLKAILADLEPAIRELLVKPTCRC
ncbi:trypsin-like peptidase domain-containing protein [Nannocystis sp. SCPEA4]|uniref:trypsin-like peptidase domain-containing protein n=1 Tax=Nannocystis sp. SCPEA4 TaxID=2996787 RepID=UPI00226E3EEF|nr:trypsin-like peptidase domain-containing protein [Nannocystis sp. SCPEA4]MCY1059688.1 trypsin-like peptidase domain-containing protein [Nannocystis sp. SCPEA4]